MKTLYIDCTSGVCADMLLSGFRALGAEVETGFEEEMRRLIHTVTEHCQDGHCHLHAHDHGDAHDKEHVHDHTHAHGASYAAVREVLRLAPLSENARNTARRIYETIALAEAKVHGETLETVHFHEVGRMQAILNVASVAVMIDMMGVDRIICSEIHDGQGTIQCSHGIIPVPVPAVKAMMDTCSYVFKTIPIDTELVTPSGLAMLIGMGAEYGARPQGGVLAKGIGYGDRSTGRSGMEIYLIEEE